MEEWREQLLRFLDTEEEPAGRRAPVAKKGARSRVGRCSRYRIPAFDLWRALDRALLVGTGRGLEQFCGPKEGRGLPGWSSLAMRRALATLASGMPTTACT